MISARSPIRNVAALTVGQAIAAASALVTNIWLARVLGPEGLGLLGFGTAIIAYLVLFTGCGSELWSARLIASKKYSAKVVISRIFGMRLWAMAAVAAIFFMAAPLLVPDPANRQVLLMQAAVVLVVPVALDYFFQGLQRQTTTAVRVGGQALLVMGLSVIFVQFRGDIMLAAMAQAVGAILPALMVLVYAVRRYHLALPDLSLRRAWKTFRRVSPFTVSAFVTTLFVTIDIVMLGILSGNRETGYYVAGSRLMMFALIPSGIIFSVAFPRLASSAVAQRRPSLELYAIVLGLVAVSGTAVALATAPVLVELIYGVSFLATVPILTIQMLTVITIHGRMAVGGGLSSWGLQKKHARSTAVAALFNVVLNVVLIPKFGGIGAAVATLMSQIVLFVLFTRALNKGAGISILAPQFRSLLCGGVALAAVFALGTMIDGIALLITGTGLSVVMVAASARLLGLIRWSEIQALWRPPATS